MRTAREILHEKATKNNDGFLSGQIRWIVDAMEEYAKEYYTEVEPTVTEEEIKEIALDFAINIQTKEGTVSRLNAIEWHRSGIKKGLSMKQTNK
jgi:hypothetical protein